MLHSNYLKLLKLQVGRAPGRSGTIISQDEFKTGSLSGLSSPEEGQCQGTFPRDAVEGRHGVGVFGIRAPVYVLHGDYLPVSLFIGWRIFPATQSQRSLLALGRVRNG